VVNELVREPVNWIVAVVGPRAARVAKAATPSVPIVFVHGGDPVRLSLVASLSRPGGNATGIVLLTADLMPERFELFRDLLPRSKPVTVIVNPNTPCAEDQVKGAEAAVRATGTHLLVARAGSESEFDSAFTTLAEAKPDALLIGTDVLFGTRHKQFIALAARNALPAIYEQRNAVVDGGLMSYGPSITEAYAQTGVYAGRVLGGARPDSLPVLQPTTFELVINRGTERTLGLVIPQSLLLRASEVLD
jgi:putative ABC transport system substrate-binding protein